MVDANEFHQIVEHVSGLLGGNIVWPDSVHHPFGKGRCHKSSGLGGLDGLFVRDVPVAAPFGCLGFIFVQPRRT